MTKKVYYTDKQIDGLIHNILRQMMKDKWVPEYIVGINRGGLVPAVKLSHYLNVPMETLTVSLRGEDGNENCESNCWMAEDAFGYMDSPKRILIVDDINDTGATFNWIKDDWSASCAVNEDRWEYVWNESTRFAVLIDNDVSPFQVNYIGTSINKTEDPQWCVFPWENWWEQ